MECILKVKDTKFTNGEDKECERKKMLRMISRFEEYWTETFHERRTIYPNKG